MVITWVIALGGPVQLTLDMLHAAYPKVFIWGYHSSIAGILLGFYTFAIQPFVDPDPKVNAG
jgi:hypothetical protein